MKIKTISLLLSFMTIIISYWLLVVDYMSPIFNIVIMLQVALTLWLFLYSLRYNSGYTASVAQTFITISSILYIFVLLCVPICLTFAILIAAVIVNLLLFILFL